MATNNALMSLIHRVVPLPNGLLMAYKWGVTNHLLTGMIVQVAPFWCSYLKLTGTRKCSSYLLNALGYAFFEIQDQKRMGVVVSCEVIDLSMNL